MSLELIRRHRCFGGTQTVWRHPSRATRTPMQFSLFLPFGEADAARRPLLFWLSGLTCSWANFTEKAGAQCPAAAHGLAVVVPDTSPRGTDLPDEHAAYDFGSGAGFWLDATQPPWAQHYRMETYVMQELPALLAENFPVDVARAGIFGHSMGGHGALTLAFRHPGRFRSLSAFSPIVAPTQVPWGQKAFRGYLGEAGAAGNGAARKGAAGEGADWEGADWDAHDACALVGRSGWRSPILIDQGTADEFLDEQLRPALFEAACRSAGVPLTLRLQDGYDHSYYFIATFIAEHIKHHATLLGA